MFYDVDCPRADVSMTLTPDVDAPSSAKDICRLLSTCDTADQLYEGLRSASRVSPPKTTKIAEVRYLCRLLCDALVAKEAMLLDSRSFTARAKDATVAAEEQNAQLKARVLSLEEENSALRAKFKTAEDRYEELLNRTGSDLDDAIAKASAVANTEADDWGHAADKLSALKKQKAALVTPSPSSPMPASKSLLQELGEGLSKSATKPTRPVNLVPEPTADPPSQLQQQSQRQQQQQPQTRRHGRPSSILSMMCNSTLEHSGPCTVDGCTLAHLPLCEDSRCLEQQQPECKNWHVRKKWSEVVAERQAKRERRKEERKARAAAPPPPTASRPTAAATARTA